MYSHIYPESNEEERILHKDTAPIRLGTPADRQKRLIQIPLRAADAKRSVQNILQWNSYLPADCVKTMVRLGWDYTT